MFIGRSLSLLHVPSMLGLLCIVFIQTQYVYIHEEIKSHRNCVALVIADKYVWGIYLIGYPLKVSFSYKRYLNFERVLVICNYYWVLLAWIKGFSIERYIYEVIGLYFLLRNEKAKWKLNPDVPPENWPWIYLFFYYFLFTPPIELIPQFVFTKIFKLCCRYKFFCYFFLCVCLIHKISAVEIWGGILSFIKTENTRSYDICIHVHGILM